MVLLTAPMTILLIFLFGILIFFIIFILVWAKEYYIKKKIIKELKGGIKNYDNNKKEQNKRRNEIRSESEYRTTRESSIGNNAEGGYRQNQVGTLESQNREPRIEISDIAGRGETIVERQGNIQSSISSASNKDRTSNKRRFQFSI